MEKLQIRMNRIRIDFSNSNTDVAQLKEVFKSHQT